MADAPDRRKRIGKVGVVLTALAVIVAAIGIYIFLSPEQFRARRVIVRIAQALGNLVGQRDRARKSIEFIVRRIERGDDSQRMLAIHELSSDLTKPADFAQVFPYLIRAMKDESEMIREASASVVGHWIFYLGGRDLPAPNERDPTIVALCPKAEEALAVLLEESSPIRGYDLRLMSASTDTAGVPTAGKSLIIVADVNHVLQFRIFNSDGTAVVDTDEKGLTDRALPIDKLRKRLENLWPPHELTKSEKDEVITAVTAVVDRTSGLRATAAKSLAKVAEIGGLDAPPPRLVAGLDDEDAQVRMAAAEALIYYRKGPELLVPVVLRRIPTESPVVCDAFREVLWFVRLEPSVLPTLVEGLSSKNIDVRLNCTAAINHMGRDARSALPAILALIRKELETPQPADAYARRRILAMAAGAIGELTPDTDHPPGAVELLCEVLKRASETEQGSDPNRRVSPISNAKASFANAGIEEMQAEAAWSLGILGRSAASAVPLLISTLEAAPESSDVVREVIAEALAEISRGTPDEDRVLASLAKAWKTASKKQKTVLARALRSLGPKSEQLVPELRQWPSDGTRSAIRRVRYPRSRRGIPVRE
jgi:HEAT repeat protein